MSIYLSSTDVYLFLARAGSRPDKVKNNLDPSGSSYVETNIVRTL